MEIDKEVQDDIYILTPRPTEEHVKVRETIVNIRNEVSTMIGNGAEKFILDLRQTSFLNSTEIGALVGCFRQVSQKKGLMIVCGIGLRLAETLAVVKMLGVFPIRLTRQEAFLELKKIKIEDKANSKLVMKNPGLEQIRHWWDSVIHQQTREMEIPSDLREGTPVIAASETVTPIPVAGDTETVEDTPISVVEERMSLDKLPKDKNIPQPSEDYFHDWRDGLEVLRTAREIYSRNDMVFTADLTFKDFLSNLAQKLIESGNTPVIDPGTD